MLKAIEWYNNLSSRVRNSVTITITLVGLLSSLFTIFGISLANWKNSSIWARIGVIIALCILIFFSSYYIIGKLYKNALSLTMRNTKVTIQSGDLFSMPGWKVIGCDTHFDTRIDDVVISKKSLHGQLVLEHGVVDDITVLVEREALRLNLTPNTEGQYDFPLGTILRYDSTVDNNTYLMLAMAELDNDFEIHTNMALYEHMLMTMWKEIDRVYASNPITLPLLGAGISRFDNGPKNKEALLKCMLCTLNSSAVTLNTEVKIVIYSDINEIPLYEYRDMFRAIPRG